MLFFHEKTFWGPSGKIRHRVALLSFAILPRTRFSDIVARFTNRTGYTDLSKTAFAWHREETLSRRALPPVVKHTRVPSTNHPRSRSKTQLNRAERSLHLWKLVDKVFSNVRAKERLDLSFSYVSFPSSKFFVAPTLCSPSFLNQIQQKRCQKIEKKILYILPEVFLEFRNLKYKFRG